MTTEKLLTRLAVAPADNGTYLARNTDMGADRLFGGQMTAQALGAAAATADPAKPTASIHVTFIERGDPDRQVRYRVEELRSGRTDLRLVRIEQGRLCALATIAFIDPDQTGRIDHHSPAPPSAAPLDLPPIDRMNNRSLLIRAEPGSSPFHIGAVPAEHAVWMQADATMTDRWLDHHQMLTYCSDLTMTATPFRPVDGADYSRPDVVSSTRSIHIWFHRPFRFDEWLQLHHRCPNASGGRALVHAHWFDRTGRAVASATQETASDLRTPRA